MLPTEYEYRVYQLSRQESNELYKFYGRVRAFVNNFFANREKLQDNLRFVLARLKTLRTDSSAMLDYFVLAHRYNVMKERSAPFENMDSRFRDYADDIKNLGESFNMFATTLLAATYNLEKIAQFFYQEVLQLQQKSSTNNLMDAVAKFNDILMFTVNMIEVRNDLKTSIQTIQRELQSSKDLRVKFDQLLINVESLIRNYQLQSQVYAAMNTATQMSGVTFKSAGLAKLGALVLALLWSTRLQ